MQIRPVELKDIPVLAELEKECFSRPWSEKVLKESFEQEMYHFFAAEEDGCVRGYISMYVTLDECDIANVAVTKEYRGRGFGDALLSHVIDYARDHELQTIFLEVRDSNAPAIFLYEKHGFQIIGKRRGYYNEPVEDAILYALHLKTEE